MLGSNDGLIVTAGPLTGLHHALVIVLAARYRLPSVYPYRHFIASLSRSNLASDLEC